MNRFASTRSEKRARQPLPGFAQCSVGSIDEDGIRYGFTTQALIARTIATAPMIVTAQSIATRQPRGMPAVKRSRGFLKRGRPAVCSLFVAIPRFACDFRRGARPGRSTHGTPQVV